MIKTIQLLICFLLPQIIIAQTIYAKAYGENKNPPVVFIHGGPSGNATLFEATTAQELASRGFYVIVYDRRGEGRSVDTTATFTYREALNDLNEIYKTFNIHKTTLIAHSFGGLVATLFTKQNPEKVNLLILAGALFSQQQTYDHILETTRQIASEQKDTLMLSKISVTAALNKNSVEYRNQCFELADENDYFKMPFSTTEANQLRKNYKSSAFYKNNIRNNQAPEIFYKNELQNNIDTKTILKNLKKQGIKVAAIYGLQDKIFSAQQLSGMKKIVGKQNFKTIDNCSHYLFVDQQQQFLETIEKWVK